MLFLVGLIGALLGGATFGVGGAVLGALVGPALLSLYRHSKKSTAPAAAAPIGDVMADETSVAALVRRVAALEGEVSALRVQVQALSSVETAVAPAPIAMPPVAAMPEPAASAPESAHAMPEPAAAVPEPGAATPAGAAAVPPDLPDTVPTPLEPELSEAAAAADWAAPSPRPPRPAPPPPLPLRERLPPFVSRLVFGGNTIVKVGVLILFLGLAFLLRYAAERVTVPIELRYAGVALVGAFLLGLGWRLRARSDAYGLILQGAGIGVFYLTALAAIKLHPLLPPALAFVFMALVAVFGALLAVVQNALWLALVSVAEGFAAPVLVSTGSGNHIALFSYLAILDVGIFLMAWFKAWRPLNLVGAVATFALAGAWAQRSYDDSKYASVQVFLLLFFVLFTFIGVLFARRALAQGDPPDPRQPLASRAAQALAQVGRVDSTLTFGVPLAAYSLQYLLVRDDAWAPAWSAFGFGLFYLLLGGTLLRGGNRRYALLGEAYVIVSVIFGTLTIPLALEGVWTGATWAVEAAGMYWLGARQQRVYARAFALAVLAGATVRLVTELGIDLRPGTPLVTGSVLGMAMLAASVIAMSIVQRRIDEDEQTGVETINALLLPVLAAASVSTIAWMLLAPLWAGVVSAWLALGCAAAQRRLRMPVLQLCAAALHAIALASLGLTLHTVQGHAMFASGWTGLTAAVLIGAALLATGWLPLQAQLQAARERDTAPVWSLASSVGLLAGIAVLDLSLLFVMPAERAALVWPWVGVFALWLSLRVSHPALALGGIALQVAAGVATLAFGPVLWPAVADPARAGLALWGPLVLSLAGFAAGDLCQRAAAAPGHLNRWTHAAAVHWALVVWALGWWCQVLPPEIHRALTLTHRLGLWPSLLTGWLLLTSVLMLITARWRGWRVLGQATWVTLPALVLFALAGPLDSPHAPSANLGWMVWPLALVWHLLLLRRQAEWFNAAALRPLHVVGFWLFVLLAAREGQFWMEQAGAPGSAWPILGWMLVPAIVLALVTRPALLRRWPLVEFRDTYLVGACAPLALYLLLWLWVANLQSGNAAPLPYLPLLNPLELGQGLVLLALALWLAALPETAQRFLPRPLLLGGLGLTSFALYTGIVLRTCHHYAGVAWDGAALFDSTLTQAALSVAWSAVGVGLMLLGHRRAQRVVWVTGAGLLGVVVSKLFLVELANSGNLSRIVSFIVVGILLLLVGYFAPVPPSRKNTSTVAA